MSPREVSAVHKIPLRCHHLRSPYLPSLIKLESFYYVFGKNRNCSLQKSYSHFYISNKTEIIKKGDDETKIVTDIVFGDLENASVDLYDGWTVVE